MTALVVGIVIFAAGTAIFWRLLPRDGKVHRFVNSELEPYLAVAICTSFTLGFGLVLVGILEQLG